MDLKIVWIGCLILLLFLLVVEFTVEINCFLECNGHHFV